MKFVWDDQKNTINIKKHGIDFETAALVFYDDNRIIRYDEKHSVYEDRYVTIGSIGGMITVIMVVFTEDDDMVRLISARLANKIERDEYYGYNKGN